MAYRIQGDLFFILYSARLKYRYGRTECKSFVMVETRKMLLDLQVEVDVPIDIVQDEGRIKAVEDGLARSISNGLYDQGVSFRLIKVGSKIE